MKFRKNREPFRNFFDCFFWLFLWLFLGFFFLKKLRFLATFTLHSLCWWWFPFSFWTSSLPIELISFSPSSSLFLTITFLLCAVPTQTLCPFPFHLPFLCHRVHSPVFRRFSVCLHSQQRWKKRGARDTNTASAARSACYESLILSFWCTSAYKSYSEISQPVLVCSDLLVTLCSLFLFPFIFNGKHVHHCMCHSMFLLSNCPSVASFEGRKQHYSLG